MDPTGHQISHYHVLRKLGEGGMGEVFEATDDRLGRRVAIKLLSAERLTTDRQVRFVREAKTAGALNHPGIVTMHDVGMWEGRLYIVMELIEGEPLSHLAQRECPPEQAFALVAEAADALAAAHAQGILHRDIKSDNLMLTKDGRIKVLDFGLAKLMSDAPPSDDGLVGSGPAIDLALLTTTLVQRPRRQAPMPMGPLPMPTPKALTKVGTVLGTPGFMSPEQTMGGRVDAQSEVFSLGIVLYELLTRHRPFDRPTLEATLTATCEEEAPPASKVAPTRGITPAMDEVVKTALTHNRNFRYPDMAAFAKAARAVSGARGPKAGPARPRLIIATALAAGLVTAAIAVLFLRHRGGPARPEPPPIMRESRRLTFDRGCEEDPTFTPDGREIVFDGLVDGDYELLAMDPVSGKRRRITHAPSWDYAPALSPDGKQIAYVHLGESEEEIRLLPLAGDESAQPVRVARSWGLPEWSRRGEILLSEDSELVARTVGPNPTRRVLAKLPTGLRATALAPFDDGELLALCGTFNQDATPSLRRLLPDGTLGAVAVGDIDAYGIEVAPSQTGFYYLRRSAAGPDELVRHARKDGSPVVVQGGAAPSGGFAIAADRHRMAYSSCKASNGLFRLGAQPVPLGAQDPTWVDQDPVALDQHRVLFTSDRGGGAQIWLLDLATGEARPVTSRDTSRVAASRDGLTIVYSDHAEPGLHVMPTAGGPPRRLTSDDSDTAAAFTRDGQDVVFVRTSPDGDRLFTIPTAGGTARQLRPETTSTLSVSPTEDRIVYLVNGHDRAEFLATDLTGAAATPVGPGLVSGYYTGLRFSPDGAHLLVVHRQNEVLELGLDGSPPVARWHSNVDGLEAVDYAPDGSIIASITHWDGDLWLASGDFP